MPTGARWRFKRLAAAGACLCLLPAVGPSTATRAMGGRPGLRLRADLRPHLAAPGAALRLSIHLSPGAELVPPPLVEGRVLFPAGLNIQLSGLGISACAAARLELFGLQACPPNSLMGYGSAVAELPIKGEVFRENARLALVRTDEQAGHPALLFYIYDETALDAEIVLVADLLPAAKPYGGLLDIHVPLVPTFVDGPYVSVGALDVVLGPESLVYSERVRGRTVQYRPAGIPMPRRCTPRGDRLAVRLGFLDGSWATRETAVSCTRRSRKAR